MPEPTAAERGLTDRGTANRIAAPPPPAADKPFDVRVIGVIGQSAIPDALTHALEWQIALDQTPDAPIKERQELAEQLLAVWHFVKDIEETAQRHPRDGALLIYDPIQVLRSAKIKTDVIELETGESILVTLEREEAPLPFWAPTRFPPEMSKEQIAQYPKRPSHVDEIPPFFPDIVRTWLVLRDFRPAQAPQRKSDGEEGGLIPLPEPDFRRPSNEKELEQALQQAIEAASRLMADKKLYEPAGGSTPLVTGAIKALSTVTLQDIQQQTQVEFKSAYADVPLIKSTQVILYHSVYTVVLDAKGEPFNLNGRLDYPILVPKPGSQMQRHGPPPGALHVSVQKYGFHAFSIMDGRIRKNLASGVGGFEEYGYGYSGPHEFHKALQSYLEFVGHSYIAAVTTEGAYLRKELTVDRVRNQVPTLVRASLPYTVKEINVRLADKIENYEAFLKQIGEQIIRALIMAKLRDMIKEFLVKKIGTKILPLVNVAFAVYDMVTGAEERTRIRHALACMILAVKGTGEEDMTIAAKTMAKIMADEFEDKIIDALVNAGAKRVTKALHGRKPKASEGQSNAPKPADQPQDAAETAAPKSQPIGQAGSENLAFDSKGTPIHQQPVVPAKNPYDALTESTQAEIIDAQRRVDAQKAAETASKAAARKTNDPGTHDRGTKDTGAKDTGAKDTGAKATGTNDPANMDAATAASGKQGVATKPGDPGTSQSGAPLAAGYPSGPPQPKRGTLENPTQLPPGPAPPDTPIPVKDTDDLPARTDTIHTTLKPRLRKATNEKILRARREGKHGFTPLDHDSHHVVPKKGGGKLGRRLRELLDIAGVHIDDEANGMPARGLPRDSRAIHESDSQHWNLHTKKNMTALLRELETVRGDEKATRDILRKHAQRMLEDRPLGDDNDILGPDDDGDDDPD